MFVVHFLDIGFQTITKQWLSKILLLLLVLSQLVFWDLDLVLLLDAAKIWTLYRLFDKVFMQTCTLVLKHMLSWKVDRLMCAIGVSR